MPDFSPLFASFPNEWVPNTLQRHLLKRQRDLPDFHTLNAFSLNGQQSPSLHVAPESSTRPWPSQTRPAFEYESCCELIVYISCPSFGIGPSSKKPRFLVRHGVEKCYHMILIACYNMASDVVGSVMPHYSFPKMSYSPKCIFPVEL